MHLQRICRCEYLRRKNRFGFGILGWLFYLRMKNMMVLPLYINRSWDYDIHQTFLGIIAIHIYGLVCGGVGSNFREWTVLLDLLNQGRNIFMLIELTQLFQNFGIGCNWFVHITFEEDRLVVLVSIALTSSILPSIVGISNR